METGSSGCTPRPSSAQPPGVLQIGDRILKKIARRQRPELRGQRGSGAAFAEDPRAFRLLQSGRQHLAGRGGATVDQDGGSGP